MKQTVIHSFQVFLYSCGVLCASGKTLLAQVTSDNTVNTQVNQNGSVAEITGGQTRGGNLFHSFQDFSIPVGNEAAFNNTNDVINIFSRVTGGNISNIDGAIRANGNANLFLINPAGIIFGEGASLDIGGSFLGSTASSILFEDGEFSATDSDSPPLLTINVPIGLNLGDDPGTIVNRSTVEDSEARPVGLEVLAGNNLSFVGGNIRFDGGNATAPGGRIELGGLATAGFISIDEEGSINFSENAPKADIFLSNNAEVDVRSTGGGNIIVNAGNLELRENSLLRAGITADSAFNDARAGDITIDATDNLIIDRSSIINDVNQDGTGNSGNIKITTGSLKGTNGGNVDASTSGRGNAGLVNITAAEDISFDGTSSEGDRSEVTSRVKEDGEGDARGVVISTTDLTLTNGGRIDTSTSGKGNGGLVNITATGDISFDGANSEGNRSEVTSRVNEDGEGNSGDVTISTTNLIFTNGGRINAATKGRGNAGLVNIIATGDISFDGATLEGDRSEVTSRVDSDGQGNAKGVNISTTNLTLTNGGRIDASTSGQGNAGFVNIIATGNMTFNGTTLEGDRSGVTSRVNKDGQGNVGDIAISTTNLNLANGGRVDTASTRETGDGGSINITATEDIILFNNSPISAQSSGQNDGGNINIDARFIIAFPKSARDAPFDTETGEEVNFAVDSLSQFSNDILASAEQGQGGNIFINAKSLFGIEERPLNNSTNDINASSEFSLDGIVEINTPDINLQRELEQSEINFLTAEQAIANSCLARSSGQASFTVGGNGGVPKNPSSNYSDTNFSLTGVASLPTAIEQSSSIQTNIKQDNQSMIPAEKMVETEDGRILLVAASQKVESFFCQPN